MAGMALDGVADEVLLAAVDAKGITAAAAEFNVARSTFKGVLKRRGLTVAQAGSSPTQKTGKVKLGLTRESLYEAMKPPNNCPVKRLLDSLDTEDRALVEEALGLDKETFSGAKLQDWLKANGIGPEMVPGVSAIADHRAGRRPCRCHD